MFYIEITLLPSFDINIHFLWQKIFQPLHLGFVNTAETAGRKLIQISFPQYDEKRKRNGLGNKLRIFADEKFILQNLNVANVLEKFSDYVHVTSIRSIPNKIESYSYFKRYQAKSITSNMRVAKQMAKMRNTSFEEEIMLIKDRKQEKTNLPYLRVISSSTKSAFKLFITRDIVQKPSKGEFTSYGLSKTATVPNF